MSKRLYVGNLSYSTTQDTLSSLFSAYGNVVSATIIIDRDTSQSKGFGFVEMEDSAETDKAIAELADKEIDGRKIRVNYAEEKKPRSRAEFSREPRNGGRGFGSGRRNGDY